MSLLFIDGFDHYATADIPAKWTNQAGTPTINSSGGRRSGGGLELNAVGEYVEKVLTSPPATLVCGLGLKLSSLATAIDFLQFLDTASIQVKIRVRTDGKLEAFNNTTSLGVSAGVVVVANTYIYLETKVLIANAGGTVTVNANGIAALTIAAVDTQNTANAYADRVRINCDAAITMNVDDLYILDTVGSAPQNNFLGDCRVDTQYPTSDGTYEQFTPSTGTDSFALVDDTTPNGDTDYVQSSVVGQKDTFLFTALPDIGGATIFGVQHNMTAKKDLTGTRKIRSVTRPNGGSDSFGTSQDLTSGYIDYREITQLNPQTGLAWAETEVNLAELGMEVAS